MVTRLEHAPRSRGIETNLEVSAKKGEILGRSLAQIASGFEQTQGEDDGPAADCSIALKRRKSAPF
jgi:hypothetical protein